MIRQHVTQVDRLELPVDQNSVTSALRWLDAIGDRENWSSELKFSLAISLDEVLTNIVAYAFTQPSRDNHDEYIEARATLPRIFLRCWSQGSHVLVKVIDNGQAFDPTQAPTPPLATSLDQAHVGGHGIRLMRHYLSDISYVRRKDLNYLSLTTPQKKTDPLPGTKSD